MIQHLLFVAIVLAAQPALAENPQQLVDRARLTLEEMLHDPDFSAATKLSKAKALLIVPELGKGGFLIGGQGGGGLLIVRQPGRGWGAPAFYSLGGATLGLQVGFQTAKMVFFVMTERALQNLLNGDFKFGAQDGKAVFVTGSQHFDGKTSQGADVVAWAVQRVPMWALRSRERGCRTIWFKLVLITAKP
jgi:lipid-binding SYLF domain-containing protein